MTTVGFFSLFSDSKRSRQTKPDKAFGTDSHLFAFLCGVGCHSRASADTCTDRGSFSASEQCSQPSTGQSANTSVLRCLLTFTLPAKCNDVAGYRVALIADHDAFQLKLQLTAALHATG